MTAERFEISGEIGPLTDSGTPSVSLDRRTLVDVITGETLPATPENAARVKAAISEMRDRLSDLSVEADQILIAESERLGTKTLHTASGKVTISGGTGTEIDGHDLRQLLAEADCPPERINEAVTEEITYKVNRSVTNQLAKANPEYRAAVELATREIERPKSVSRPKAER